MAQLASLDEVVFALESARFAFGLESAFRLEVGRFPVALRDSNRFGIR
jgi:hypothetical protein